jgi:cardiolipin synthase
VLIVDDELLSTGTANMDLRSFNHNFEVAAMIYDKSITAQALEHFAEDMSKSRKIELAEFQRRSIFKKGVESLCRLFSPLL